MFTVELAGDIALNRPATRVSMATLLVREYGRKH